MFAVVRAGGAQFKVRGGDRIRVSFMPEKKPMDRIQLSPLALEAAEDFFLGGDLKKVSVTAVVLRHGLGKKILVFKKKRRKGYRRTRGHRQAWTDLQITEIKAPGGKVLFQEKTGSPAPLKAGPSPQAKAPSVETAPTKTENPPSAGNSSAEKPLKPPSRQSSEKSAQAKKVEKPVKGKKSATVAKRAKTVSRRGSGAADLDKPPAAEVKAGKETKKGKTPLPG